MITLITHFIFKHFSLQAGAGAAGSLTPGHKADNHSFMATEPKWNCLVAEGMLPPEDTNQEVETEQWRENRKVHKNCFIFVCW